MISHLPFDLKAIWDGLADRLGLGTEIWIRLVAAYGESHRHYHTLDHIRAVVARYEDLRDRFDDPDAALLALFFHDIVYDPARQDNEDLSAETLAALLSGKTAERACRHIVATRTHEADDDPDTALVVDIDMSILAAPWPKYLAYAENVAREYLPVYGVDAYQTGRNDFFLQPMIMRDRIFVTETFAPCEAAARDNLKAERALWQTGAFAARLHDD